MAKVIQGQQIDTVLVNALYTAARVYEDCAAKTREDVANAPSLEALAVQFDKQALDARTMAEELECAEVVSIHYA